jgi:16S rRNA processing protein RimM
MRSEKKLSNSKKEGPDRIVIGEIVGPFGHRGEVKVYPLTDFPDRLLELKTLRLRNKSRQETLWSVRRSRPHKNIVVMALEDVESMTDAEDLRGLEIVILPDERVELPKDTYFVDDLLGLRVRTDDGRDLGMIKNVLKNPANDVYDLGNLLIPAIKDVVVSVDIQNGVMVIHPIPGLLDEPEVA